MANRYNIPARQPSARAYVPVPIEQIAQGAALIQDRWDKTEVEKQKVPLLMSQVQAIDAHDPYKKERANYYASRLEQIADKIPNQANPDYMSELVALQNEFVTDPIIQELGQSYGEYQKDVEKRKELGNKYADWWNSNYGWAGAREDGTINPYRQGIIGERQDHAKYAQDLMGGLKPSGNAAAWFDVDPTSGFILKAKEGYEGIAEDWIATQAKAQLPLFLGSKEGEDFIKQMQFQAGGQLTPEQEVALAEDYLFRAGSKQIFQKTTNERDITALPQWYMDMQANKTALVTATTSVGDLTKNKQLVEQQITYDDKGNITINSEFYKPTANGKYEYYVDKHTGEKLPYNKIEQEFKQAGVNSKKDGQAYNKFWAKYDRKETTREEVEKPLKVAEAEVVSTFKEIYPNTKLTNRQIVEAQQSGIKGMQLVQPVYKDLSTGLKENLTKQIANTGSVDQLLDGRRAVILNGKRAGESVEQDTIEDVADFKKEEVKAISIDKISTDNPYGMPGGLKVTVALKDGTTRDLLVENNLTSSGAFNPVQTIANAKNSGKSEVLFSMDKNGNIVEGIDKSAAEIYRVVNTPLMRGGEFVKDSRGNIKMQSIVERSKGGVIEEMSADEAIESMYQSFTIPILSQYRYSVTGTGGTSDSKESISTE